MTDETRDPAATDPDRSWKRRLETGMETLIGEGRLKGIIPEMRLPREIVNHILGQVDETKQAAIKAIARETREFLEHTSIADELAKLLTQVSLQVELRFVPNEKAVRKKRKEAPPAEEPAGPGETAP
jgi:hypothetical protein